MGVARDGVEIIGRTNRMSFASQNMLQSIAKVHKALHPTPKREESQHQ